MRAQDRERLAERARHAVYGSVIVLAVIVALDGTAARTREVIASVIAAAIATVVAETYADYLAETISVGRRPTRRENAEALRNAWAGLLAAILPVVFFVLTGLGLMALDTAFRAAIWTGVAVVGFYAVVANRVSGLSIARSVAAGTAFTALGALLVLVKALASH
jgi:VIT1/CCC1 family predicted Fe2+/Mn2+ transporter